VAEDDGLPRTPVLVIDLRAVFRCDRAHLFASFENNIFETLPDFEYHAIEVQQGKLLKIASTITTCSNATINRKNHASHPSCIRQVQYCISNLGFAPIRQRCVAAVALEIE
jgi:hypothetical protein